MHPDLPFHQLVLERIAPFVHRTPVLTSSILNAELNTRVYFKSEHLQRMGAFKMRGATNAALQLSEAERINGLCTHSSGNHGQAVALAAASLNVPAFVVVPKNAPVTKVEAMKAYGAQLTFCEPTQEAREQAALEIINRTGATFIHPSNDPNVIWGQGTAVLELLQDHPQIDALLIAVGGGGLLAGSCLAAKAINPNIKVYGAEPSLVPDAKESLDAGYIIPSPSFPTVADGLRTSLGSHNFPVISEFVEDILLVEEEEIIRNTKWTWEYMKQVIEPSAAVPLAALRNNQEMFKNKHVGIVLCGGNVDLSNLPF